MVPHEEIYHRLIGASLGGKLEEETARLREEKADEKELEALLHPNRQPIVMKASGECTCGDKEAPCQLACLFSAIQRDENGKLVIKEEHCTGCGACIASCKEGRLQERKDLIPLLELLQGRETPVYAMIAPAFMGQFSPDVTAGKLRCAFKKLGFQGMIEVALFADVLTLKEALEYDRQIQSEGDFLLTSCCCPLWVAVIRKLYSALTPHIPPSVSPMAACGRSVKRIHPEAKTVFIGPCLAKKAEAREADIADAVDIVLTFQETQELFEAAGVDPGMLEDDHKDHSSRGGRIYARTGGVSEAVEKTLEKLKKDRKIPFRAKQADGMLACKALLEEVSTGNAGANFLEGMGCRGGCVGGPRAMIPTEEGRKNVNEYGKQALYETPVDNPYTIALLKRLGYDTVEALLERDNMFIRKF